MKRKVALPTLHRKASVQPKTLDRDARTFEVVWTTGAKVRRDSFWDGVYYEELGLKKSEVRMERLKNGAPFLDNHGFTEARGVKQTLGVIDSAKLVSGKEGTAVVRLSKRAEADGILDDIADGILRHVSVGYDIHKFEKVSEEDGIPTFRATDWEPIEISLVPAGADDLAMVRSASSRGALREVPIDGLGDDPDGGDPDGGDPDEGGDDPDNNSIPNKRSNKGAKAVTDEERKKIAAEAKKLEKERQTGIRAVVKKLRLKDELATEWIESDKTLEEVRSLAIDAAAEKDADPAAQIRSSNSNIEVGDDLTRTARVEGITNALLHRFRPKTERMRLAGKDVEIKAHELSEQGKPYAFRSLSEIARMIIEENGMSTAGMSKTRVIEKVMSLRAAHGISDFPEILANTVNRTLRDGYIQAPQTWQPFTREVFEPDFKEISRTNLGDAPELLEVAENGEVERGTMSEGAEKYRLAEFARIVAITRKIIINDDLNAFTRIPERMGRRAADLESDLVWNIMKANANLADGFALFSAQHSNLSTAAAAPDETGLNEARAAMRRQVGLDGAEIAIIPRWLYVPPAHETAAEKLVATITPASAGNVNPFSPSGRTPLQLGVEPRMETGVNGSLTAWFVLADLGQVDMIELARLEGTDGPQTQSREGFDVHGTEIKIMHDIGAKAIEHRGMFKNAGA